MTHLLIAGHGKRKNGTFDPGATGIIKKGENRYMKEDLFPAMKKFLPKDHDLVFFDDYNVYSHGNIVALANKYNATQITEFHYDAASSSATGGHVIIYDGYKPDKMDLALRDVIKDMVGTIYNHKGHAGISGRSNLANVNRTKSAGITYRLVELGFGTNANDAKVLTGDVEIYAKKLVKTLTGDVNDKKPSQSKPSKPSNPETSKPSKASGRVESKVNGLRFYNKPSWDDKDVVGHVDKGIGFPTIISKIKVGNGHQYKVKNSKGSVYYITASSKYVKVIGDKPKTSKPASKPKPTIKVGQTVTLKKSASKFATGQSILNSAKGKKYKIIQVKSDRVLLDKIMSWVKKSDVE